MKRTPFIIALGAALIASAVVQPSLAKAKPKPKPKPTVKVKRYDAPGAGVYFGGRNDPTCGTGACRAASDGRLDFGKVTFDPIGKKPRYPNIKVVVRDDLLDDNTSRLRVTACADRNEDSECTTDRVIVQKCVRSGEALRLINVERTSPIVIQVFAAWSCTRYAADIVDDSGSGTSGTVTITYS